jgi:FKBP-type peptidyl-prolyl cis-trans isomerase SlyD
MDPVVHLVRGTLDCVEVARTPLAVECIPREAPAHAEVGSDQTEDHHERGPNDTHASARLRRYHGLASLSLHRSTPMSHESHRVADGKVVGIYYTLKDPSGAVLDTNRRGGRPLAYLHGAGNILPALERALVGKQKDDEVRVEIPAAEGYGEKSPDAVRNMPRSAFPASAKVQPGARFQGQDPTGKPVSVLVTAVDGDTVTVDHNHPLAGVALHFEVTIAGVRAATAEEEKHRHPHGPGGHSH